MIVHDIIRECDKECIAKQYAAKYISTYDRPSRTGRELYYEIRRDIEDLIDRLSVMKPKENDGHIFLAAHGADLFGEDVEFYLFRKTDILEGRFERYGYEFTPFEEVLGYEVADTYLMKYYLNDFIVELLYEMTWTGMKQEHLEERVREIESAEKDIDAGRVVSADEVFGKLGVDIEEKDPEQIKAEKIFIRQMAEYCNKCIEIEVEKWKKSVR